MEKVKKIILSSIKQTDELDDTVVDYMCDMLQDEALLANKDELFGSISPMLIDSKCATTDEEAENVIKQIVSKMAKDGIIKRDPFEETLKVVGGGPNQGKDLKILTNTINLSQAISEKLHVDDNSFDWMKKEVKNTLVDQNKLEKLEAKREKRKEKKKRFEELSETKILNPASKTKVFTLILLTQENQEIFDWKTFLFRMEKKCLWTLVQLL